MYYIVLTRNRLSKIKQKKKWKLSISNHQFNKLKIIRKILTIRIIINLPITYLTYPMNNTSKPINIPLLLPNKSNKSIASNKNQNHFTYHPIATITNKPTIIMKIHISHQYLPARKKMDIKIHWKVLGNLRNDWNYMSVYPFI